MPAGLDEGAAILAFLSLAFKLTTTLITYSADVQEAQEELRSLLGDLNTVQALAAQLDRILKKNLKTRGLRNGAETVARECRADAARTVKKLQTLAKRSGAMNNDTDVTGPSPTLSTVNMTLLSRMMWPLFKPQVEKARKDVDRIANRVMLVQGLYLPRSWWARGAHAVLVKCMAYVARIKQRLDQRIQDEKLQAKTYRRLRFQRVLRPWRKEFPSQ